MQTQNGRVNPSNMGLVRHTLPGGGQCQGRTAHNDTCKQIYHCISTISVLLNPIEGWQSTEVVKRYPAATQCPAARTPPGAK